ncbi:MAG: type II toxin-antitoxin system RelE/ParE family toxin [Legionella sp.]|uniref:type II toxin-antitoxin system RelE/ParE family toxin n=1 Tax=Legionella sp. TaxID=459 RepID=UPI00283EBBA1|nr:type II toxin-antitoxin system RelE/ParE family toxin [Legionella sp.]
MLNKTYRLYPKAIADLESIYSYSTREFGIKRTEDYILAIDSSFQHLADDSLISRKCDYIRPDLRTFNENQQ